MGRWMGQRNGPKNWISFIDGPLLSNAGLNGINLRYTIRKISRFRELRGANPVELDPRSWFPPKN